MAPCGCVLLAGLSDGGVRAYAVSVAAASKSEKSAIRDPSSGDVFTLIQFIKPHTAPVVSMGISFSHKYVATISKLDSRKDDAFTLIYVIEHPYHAGFK